MLLSGCPMAAPNWKLPWVIESSGAVIVGEESCVGERGTRNLTDDSGETMDELMEAIVDRYFKIDCAVFTPNSDRLEHVKANVSLLTKLTESFITGYNSANRIRSNHCRLKSPRRIRACRHLGSIPTTAWKTLSRSRLAWKPLSSGSTCLRAAHAVVPRLMAVTRRKG